MRKIFSAYIQEEAAKRDDLVFITGDLGYAALENVRAALGDRFINAGVAEQNMIGMAAGMAAQGFQVICYSIAPFVVYRCLEQIRNDVCFHNMPVYIVGNGGGFGYGIMGSSHHAIEDIGTLSGLPNMTCYVPAYADDLKTCMATMLERKRPAYLRLGLARPINSRMSLTSYGAAAAPNPAAALTIITQGPVCNNVDDALKQRSLAAQTDIFVLNTMPLLQLPEEILASMRKTKNVLVVEEHVAVGGLGSAVSLHAHQSDISINRFRSLHVTGYPNSKYGSQSYHQQVNGIDARSIADEITRFF